MTRPLQVGDKVFDVTVPGSSREHIADFSTATEDPNPIHVDEVFAREAGFPQVIQQGPMTTAHFGRLLKDEFGSPGLRSLDVTFLAPVFPGEPLDLSGTVAAIDREITLDLVARKADGTETAKGTAVVRPVEE